MLWLCIFSYAESHFPWNLLSMEANLQVLWCSLKLYCLLLRLNNGFSLLSSFLPTICQHTQFCSASMHWLFLPKHMNVDVRVTMTYAPIEIRSLPPQYRKLLWSIIEQLSQHSSTVHSAILPVITHPPVLARWILCLLQSKCFSVWTSRASVFPAVKRVKLLRFSTKVRTQKWGTRSLNESEEVGLIF